MNLPHLPALRLGRAYESLEKTEARDHRTGEPVVSISQVNAGIIRKDLERVSGARNALKKFRCEELIEICAKAGELFLNGTLPVGDTGTEQTPGDYVGMLARTSGLPHTLVRRNMTRIHGVLTRLRTILSGLTRGLDLAVIDRGFGEQAGGAVSFFTATQSIGLVMPSNSPAVNSLWLPAIALKIPVILKPGRDEPLTPYRLIQAFIAAGGPAGAFGFYPTDHEGADTILRSCGRALVFGDKTTTDRYAGDPRIQVHGPGYSKILIGNDEIENWEAHLDVIADSVAQNSGRSCLNASTIVVPKFARELADALARRLVQIIPRSLDDPDAQLSAFANPKMAESINASIDEGLETPGAEDLSARHRQEPRLTVFEGGTFLLPTIVRCDSIAHPLANREFLFPYAGVVEAAQEKMLEQIGPSLVVTAITRDERFISQLLESAKVDRLNIGPIPTMQVAWDQPHEGNLFDFLYKRRAIQR